MRIINFAKRNFKELIRDPLGLFFTIILPLVLLFIFSKLNIPSDNFKLENFTPGIIVFGLSFITLFSSTLISKDRNSSLLVRLGVSPMKPAEYILGYLIALIPIIIIQNILFMAFAVMLGLKFNINFIFSILISILVSIIYIMLGILVGSIFSEKSSSGVSSIIVQIVCFTSGMYFTPEMVGKGFNKVCEFLPFKSTLVIIKGIMNNNLDIISIRNIVVLIIYTLCVFILSSIIFKNNMQSDKK